MRVSTSMVFESGLSAMQKRTSESLTLQQQISANKRLLKPSDDPVAAAQALVVSQAQGLNTLYTQNQGYAKDALTLSQSQLQAADEIVQRVHELTVQLGNTGTLSDSSRTSITTELRQRFEELMGIANQQDGTGSYLFSGFRGDTKPFTGSVDTGVTYNGDTGQRTVSVSGSRNMEISDSGRDIFMAVTDKSKPFAVTSDALNKGTGAISAPVVTDSTKWNSAFNNKNYTIKFAVSAGPTTTYDVVDQDGISLLTNTTAVNTSPLPADFTPGKAIELKAISHDVISAVAGGPAGATVTSTQLINRNTWGASGNKPYTITFGAAGAYTVTDSTTAVIGSSTYMAGGTISVNGVNVKLSALPVSGQIFTLNSTVSSAGNDFGASVTLSGSPSNGDTFAIRPSSPVSVFDMISDMIHVAETPVTDANKAALQKQVDTTLANILSAQDSILKVRTAGGARLNEVDSLEAASSQRDLDYTATMTRLEKSSVSDMTQAVTELSQTQLTLQAAQMSFSKITQLSLFNYI